MLDNQLATIRRPTWEARLPSHSSLSTTGSLALAPPPLLTGLAQELLNTILEQLEALNLIAAKLSCKRRFNSHGDFSELVKRSHQEDDNPWEIDLVRGPNAEKLSYVLCREKNHRRRFLTIWEHPVRKK